MGGALILMAAGSFLELGGLPSMLLLGAGVFAANYLLLAGRLRDAARLRIVVTVVFGLIHGFGFAADLLELHLPPTRLFRILLGFNLGVEVGQLTIVVDTVAAGLVGLGVYWFISRSYAL
jgi:hypothetical protein